jgi:D-lactate dehydrogenase
MSLSEINEFCGLPSDILSAIDLHLQLIPFSETPLIREDESQSHIFFILKGSIRRVKHGVHIDTIRAPSVNGLLHAFQQEKTHATIFIQEDSVVYSLETHQFRLLLEKFPRLSLHLLEKFSLRLRTQTKWQRERLSSTCGTRVVFFDAKSYDVNSFEAILPSFNEKAPKGKEFELTFLSQRLSSETASAALNADAVCIFVNDQCTKDVVEQLAKMNVKLIALRCAGYDGVDLKACYAFGIPVVRVPSYSPQAIAEHAVALMLTLGRQIHRAYQRTKDSNFSLERLVGMDFFGKTVGVVGTGKIGRFFAQIMRGFSCNVLLYDVYPDSEWASAHQCTYTTFDNLLSQSDVISIHIPLFPSTRHLFNRDSFAKMKHGSFLLNTSRGAIIETDALLDALQSGRVGAAGLDVYENERHFFFNDHSFETLSDVALSRLTNMPNVILTGHQAYLTHRSLAEISRVTFENMSEYCWHEKKQPLTNQVLDELSLHKSTL